MAGIFRILTLRLALVMTGAGLAAAGLVLLLRAAWIAIAVPLGPMWASVVMGGALLLVGALVVSVATRQAHRPAQPDTDLIVQATNAFLQGLAAGRSVRHSRASED